MPAHGAIIGADVAILALGALFCSASLVAAMRVIEISTGRIARPKRQRSSALALDLPAIDAGGHDRAEGATSKKFWHMKSRRRCASVSSFGFSLASFWALGSSGRSAT